MHEELSKAAKLDFLNFCQITHLPINQLKYSIEISLYPTDDDVSDDYDAKDDLSTRYRS